MLRELVLGFGFKGKEAIANVEKADKAMDEAKKTAKELGKQWDDMSNRMAKVGKDLTKKVTAPVLAIATAATMTVANFDDKMSEVRAVSGATAVEFQELRKQARELGRDTRWSASEAAEGQINLATAGFQTNEILAAMPGLLDLASAGNVDLATASEIAAGALRGFGLAAEQAGHVADVLAKAASTTNAQIPDLGEGLKYVAPLAKALGISLEDTVAAMGALADVNIKGSMAGTTLRSMFTSLVNPVGDAAEMMDALGFQAFDATGKMLPLPKLIENLRYSLRGLSDQERSLALSTMFGQMALSGVTALVEAGPEKVGALAESFKDADGAAKEMATIMEDNLGGSLRSLKSAAEELLLSIGDVVKGPVRDLADGVRDIAIWLSEADEKTKVWVIRLALIAAAIGPALTLVSKLIIIGKKIGAALAMVAAFGGKVVFAFQAVAGGAATLGEALLFVAGGPVGLVIAGLTAVIAIGIAVYKNWDKIKTKGQELYSSLVEVGQGIKERFGKALESIGNMAKSGINTAISWVNKGIESLNKFKLPEWIPGIGGAGINIKPIQPLARGTSFHTGGPALVGEKGPELINLKRGSSVTPANETRRIISGTTQNIFSPQINVTIEGGVDKDTADNLKYEVQKVLYPMLEEYWMMLQMKRPNLTEA